MLQLSNSGDIMNKLNQILYDEFDKMDVFTTCIVSIVDTQKNTLDISNAGHYCPIIIDDTGNISTENNLCKEYTTRCIRRHKIRT
ncbi:MAG: SpoIIE family protein phosphatase [Paeniclostridium sp.]